MNTQLKKEDNMLPSMPLLMTPMKELGDDSSCSSDDSPTHHSIENGLADQHIATSYSVSTLGNCSLDSGGNGAAPSPGEKVRDKSQSPEKRTISEPTSAQKKKKKNQHKKILAALTPDRGDFLEASALNFAEVFFQKVRNRLDDEKWSQFVLELVSFEEQPDSEKRPVELYRKMEEILKLHSDLVDEFLGFLLPHQALEVNRVMAYLSLGKMSEFFRKLNILLMKRQVRQVFAALEALTVKPNVTLSDVKEAVLPLLRSSPLLTNLFLELLPGERPPDSLMTDFEQVDVKEDSEFETVTVPDGPDPYGSENCVCQCHQSQTRHCITCGIKYLNGRVYIQYGKALRPVKVTFLDKKHLDLLKWEEEKCRNRRRLMPKTMLSPNSFDHRLNPDSEDDCGVKKSPRTPRIRVTRPKVCKKDLSGQKEEEILEGIFPLVESKNIDNNAEELVDSEMKHDGMDEHDFDEIVLENECNTEEDEEEYLNKGLHSENESSMEAEDIAKELECSFEDEEVDDIENSEIYVSENLTNYKDDESMKTLDKGINDVQCENLKSVAFKTEPTGEDKSQNSECLDGSSLINTKSECDINVKDEPMSVCPMQEDEVKVQNEITDQTVISGCSDLKIDGVSKTEVKNEQCAVDSSNKEILTGSRSSDIDTSCKEWTREEDKIILQTFQHENGLEQTFETASLQLPNRSKEEIQERFEVLMKLLKEMISDESNSNP